METVDIIKREFRARLAAMPYDKITIKDICEGANVSKKTLYKYFAGKPEIVEALYYDDFVAPVEALQKILPVTNIKSASLLMSERDFETLYSQRDIYCNLLKNYGRMQFIDLIIRHTEDNNRRIYATRAIQGADLDFSAYYVAASSAMLKVRWMETGFKESPKAMAKLFIYWVMCRFRHHPGDISE
jgi:AcrR family transcriptional regulator